MNCRSPITIYQRENSNWRFENSIKQDENKKLSSCPVEGDYGAHNLKQSSRAIINRFVYELLEGNSLVKRIFERRRNLHNLCHIAMGI